MYYSAKIQQESNDSRVLWNIANFLLAKNLTLKKIELSKNNKLMSGTDAATKFKDYFIFVANDPTKDLGPVRDATTFGVPF